jgi:ring-1,2-phenylacetyl-CoA epoxidase subunit PaaE
MSIHFHRLTVKDVKRETTDCISVTFEIPAALQKNFTFQQGQSLTMRTHLNNEEVRRTYSICSSPLDNEWRVAIKKVEGGLFSSFANQQLKKGDVLEVMEPVGRFYTALHPSHRKRYLAIAAGSGITPVISIIKTTLRTEPESSFTLFYGNKTRHSVIFFEELEGLKNKYLQRFTLVHILSRERTEAPIHSGRINGEKLEELSKLVDYRLQDEIFICGPEAMIFTATDFLKARGIDKKKIHFELFTTPGQKARDGRPEKEDQRRKTGDHGPLSKIQVKLDGRSFEFGLALNSDTTILDGALQQGADLPYACKGGVCCTCKAKLLEGRVAMDVHWGLEEEEIQQGYILACQSHPLTENVTVDFDIK